MRRRAFVRAAVLAAVVQFLPSWRIGDQDGWTVERTTLPAADVEAEYWRDPAAVMARTYADVMARRPDRAALVVGV